MLQLQQAPDNAEAHANLGAALLSVGRAREGIAETEIGLRLDPTQEIARRNLARASGSAGPPGP
jgi:Flp pilus assembly protein TadD